MRGSSRVAGRGRSRDAFGPALPTIGKVTHERRMDILIASIP